jgi:hypothetical protein
MRTFKDSSGRQWLIDLPFGEVLRVKSASEGRFNLLDPLHKVDGVEQIELVHSFDRLELFWELLWHLIAPEATRQGIDAEQFGLAMGPGELLLARAAFTSEWLDFFRQCQRADAVTALEKTIKFAAAAQEMANRKLAEAMLGIDPKIEAKMAESLNVASGEWLESLDAILAPTPGGNST